MTFAPSLVIVDIDAGIVPAEVGRVAAALQRQMIEHLAPSWGIVATVRAATHDDPPRLEEWRLELRKAPTIDDALGFHDMTPEGTPILYVFPALCAQDGTTWSSCASHEICEALVDPYLRRCVQADTGVVWAEEICDAVEGDSYFIDDVEVSNFCLPAWGQPPPSGSGPFDQLNCCQAPFELRPLGYGQTWDGSSWKQIGIMRPYRRRLHDLGISRGRRRAS